MRKLKLFFMTLLLMLVCHQAYAKVKNDIFVVNHYIYRVTDVSIPAQPEVSIIGTDEGFTGNSVTIPERVKAEDDGIWYLVTAVGNDSRQADGSWSSRITKVTYENNGSKITKFESNAFKGCNLQELDIPQGLETIEKNIAPGQNIKKFKSTNGNGNFLVDNDVLYGDQGKSLILIPCAGNILDGEGNFTIREGCIRIVNPAAVQHKDMKTLTLPSTLTEINVTKAPGAFWGERLPNLKIIKVSNNNNFSVDSNGVLYDKDRTKLIYCPAGIDFYDGANLEIPSSVKEIAAFAFSNSKIPWIKLNNVTTLAHADSTDVCSFYRCNKLTKVSFKSALKASQLAGAFNKCKVTEYELLPGEVSSEISIENGIIYNAAKDTLILFPNGKATMTSTEFPTTVNTIGVKAFSGAGIKTIEIPGFVKKIANGAFMDCDSLTEIKFNEGLHTIGKRAFQNAGGKIQIKLPKSLEYINENAFEGCQFTKITIAAGSKLWGINSGVFSNCDYLEAFVFEGNTALENFKGIDEYAFKNATSLTSITIPNSERTLTIGEGAFYGCSNLRTVTFDNADKAKVYSIGTAAFANCGIKNITLPKEVRSIGKEAFRDCQGLTTVTLGKYALPYDPTNENENLKGINPEAFVGCTNLKKFEVDETNNKLASVDGYLCDYSKKKLLLFPPGAANKDYTLLPPTLKEIGDYAFYNIQGLTNIVIPASIESFGARAFGLSNNLKSIAFLGNNYMAPLYLYHGEPTGNESCSFDNETVGTQNMLNKSITVFLTESAYNKLAANGGDDFKYKQFFKVKKTFKKENAIVGGEDEFMPIVVSGDGTTGTAYLLKPGNTNVKTYVVPDTVTYEGITYNVELIGDSAFANNTNIEEVIINHQVNYIGKNAFRSNKIKKVVFASEQPARDLACTYFKYPRIKESTNTIQDEYAEFNVNHGQLIYVPAGSLAAYQASEQWADYRSLADGRDFIRCEMKAANNKLTKGQAIPFSREFAIDLSDTGFKAYVPKEFSGYGYTADGKLKAYYYMQPLEVKANGVKQVGTYVPAGTPVMLYATTDIEAEDAVYKMTSKDITAENNTPYLKGALYDNKQYAASVDTTKIIGYALTKTGEATRYPNGTRAIANHNSAIFLATSIGSNPAAPATLHVPTAFIQEAELLYEDPNQDKYTTTLELKDQTRTDNVLRIKMEYDGPINVPSSNNGIPTFSKTDYILKQNTSSNVTCNGKSKYVTFKGKIKNLTIKTDNTAEHKGEVVDSLNVLPSSLKKLTCKRIGLKSLNVSNLTDLQGLDCSNNHLDKLDLSNENLHIQQMITNGNATLDDYDISGQTVEGGKILVEQNPADDNNYWIYLTYDKKEGYDKRAIVKAVNDWEPNGTTEDYRVSTGLSSFGTSSEVLEKLATLPVNVTAEQSHVQQISPISGMTSGWGAGTIYLGFPADIPEGIWASYARQIVEGGVTTQSITDPENNVYYSIPAEYGLETVAEAGWYVWREASGNLTQYKNPATFPNLFGGSLEVITPENIDQIAMYTENGKRLTRINRWNRKVGLYRVAVLGRSPYGGVGYGNYTGYSVNEETDEVSNPKSFPANRAWIQMSLAIQPDYTGQFNAKPFVYEATDNMIPVEKEGVNREIEELFYRGNSENPTSINGIEFETNTSIEGAEIYDLSGRKMQNGNLKKGIYIVNGRKTVISK